MGHVVYILCALSSLACMILLMVRYGQSRVPLLFWSSVAFLAFTLTNILLFVDLIIVPDWDMAVWRNLLTLSGVTTLLFGLIHNNT
jgi:hypothetical protein